MQIIHGIQNLEPDLNLILTTGVFDGVHKGHQSIIHHLNKIAKEKSGHSALLSFYPHPRHVLQPDADLKLLTLLPEKERLLEEFGLDYLILQEFTFDFSRISSLEFVRDYLVNQLHIHTLIVGHDHHFGRNRSGNFEQLKELADLYSFETQQLSAILESEKPISSTKVRKALHDGDIPYVNEALGHLYPITGKVVHGDKIGRTLGYPTLNLAVSTDKLIPRHGIYGVKVKVNGNKYFGLLYIGTRPTVEGMNERVEIYIMDFNQEVYDSEVQAEILCFLREDQRFENLETLQVQMQKDEADFREFLKRVI